MLYQGRRLPPFQELHVMGQTENTPTWSIALMGSPLLHGHSVKASSRKLLSPLSVERLLQSLWVGKELREEEHWERGTCLSATRIHRAYNPTNAMPQVGDWHSVQKVYYCLCYSSLQSREDPCQDEREKVVMRWEMGQPLGNVAPLG